MAEPAKSATRPPALTLEDLRPILLGPEQHRIARLEDRLDRHLRDEVAGVLPEAVAESNRQGEALGWALDPLVERCLRRTVARDPGAFADAIAPALGPGIRMAVRRTIRIALERFEQALDRSLSLASMRWRLEARRTGRPFAEVVLLRALVYRVEHVFLIHRATGLLLEHLTSDESKSPDPDQVSAMLSAIETFTYEAFREDARLSRFDVGNLTGWVEHGPAAILVAVVRGRAPESFEGVLREALERAHLECAPELTDFRGDTAPFARTRDTLSTCLQERREMPRPRSPLVRRAARLAVPVIALALILAGLRRWYVHRQAFAAYADALRAEPGFVVIVAEAHGDHPSFTGLRDPLASEPAAVLAQHGLDPGGATTRFAPYVSLDPQIVARRVDRTLHPPPGVSLRFQSGVVEARGVAPRTWIARARSTAPLMPGVVAFDDRHLRDQDAIAQAEASARALDAEALYFPVGSAEPVLWQLDAIDRIARRVNELRRTATAAGLRARIEVLGYADPTGPPEANDRLAAERARRVAEELSARGVPAEELAARGAGVRDLQPAEAAWQARSAGFHVDLSGEPDG